MRNARARFDCSSLLGENGSNSQSKCLLDGGQFATPDLRYSIPEESRENGVDLSCPQVVLPLEQKG